MNKQNFDELCRLCLSPSEIKYSLLTNNVLEKVESLAPIQIKENDFLPTFCCTTCLTHISDFYKFRQEILRSDKVLRDMLAKIESDPKVLELAKESPELFEVLHENQDEDFEIMTTNNDIYCIKDEPIDDETRLCINKNTETVSLSSDESTVEALSEKHDSNNGLAGQANKQNASWSCEECNRKFETKQLLKRHIKGHKVEICTICTLVIRKDNFKKHLEIHDSKIEICDVCGRTAKNKESLRGHFYYAHRNINKQVKCELCNKEFKHNNHYRTHVRQVHLAIRNLQCELCGNRFSNGYGLKKHINMTHYRARPYICQHCKKGFSSPYALKTHMRQHTLETPYSCEYCDQAFRQKVSLVTHMKSKHCIFVKKEEPN